MPEARHPDLIIRIPYSSYSSLIVLIGRPNSLTSASVRSGNEAVPAIFHTTVT